MKKFLLFLLLFLSYFVTLAQVHVRGYYRKNGTYVRPHVRTRPNHTVTDNYSYPGNYNPNTGRITGEHATSNHSTAQPATKSTDYTPVNTISSEAGSVTKKDEPIASVNTEMVSGQLYAVVESNAALKKEPSYMAHSIYAIPKGAVVEITKYNDNYYSAKVNGLTGYLCTCQVLKTTNKSL